ncbi:MAG: diacylglycerol kinase family protein [Pseudomonadota bacterium]
MAAARATDRPWAPGLRTMEAASGYARARVRSFGYAIEGLGFVVATQPHAKLHGTATVLVFATGLLLEIRPTDWLWLIAATAAVWVAEILNTAVEHLCDVVSPEQNLSVKRAKDVAASAVLITSAAALAIGLTVLLPYLTGAYPSLPTSELCVGPSQVVGVNRHWQVLR